MTPAIGFLEKSVRYFESEEKSRVIINAGLAKVKVIDVHGLECGSLTRQKLELTFNLRNGQTYTCCIPIDALEGRRELSTAIGNIRVTITGSNADILALRRWLPSHPNYSTGTEFAYSGIHLIDGKLLYVDKNGSLPSGGTDTTASPEAPCRTVNGLGGVPAGDVIDLLHQYGPIDRCISVIGFSMACLLNYHLTEIGYEIPILFLTGESGAGKSKTMEYILQPLACCTGIGMIDAGAATKFTLYKSAALSNTTPMYIDEYKPTKFTPNVRNLLSDFLRNIYSRGTMQRGTKDQSIREYPARRPVVLAGENGFDEVALKTRSITCAFYQRDLTPERKAAFEQLADGENALNSVGWQMLDFALSLSLDDLRAAIGETEKYVPAYLNQERVRKNFKVILAGYMLFCRCFGADKNISEAAEALAASIYKNVMESTTVVENESIQFLRALAEMTEVGVELPYYLKPDYDFYVESDIVMFNFTGLYPKYCDYCIHVGVTAIPKSDIRRQLRNNPQILLSNDKRMKKGNRVYEIALKALPDDISEQFRLAAGVPETLPFD